MALSLLMLLIFIIGISAFVVCRQRILAMVAGNPRSLHSLPNFYGWHGFVMAVVPAILVLATWLIVQPLVVERQLMGFVPAEVQESPPARTLFMADVRRVAGGLDVAISNGIVTAQEAIDMPAENVRGVLAQARVALGSDVSIAVLDAAQDYRALAVSGALWRSVLALVLSIAGAAYAVKVTAPLFRARNRVELVVQGLLILASTIAILTTVGIVLSMLSESIRFFSFYSFQDFLFGLTWSPNFRGNSQLGLVPLLWGTLYISLVSMIVAVPTGLFTAIYLAEYASPRVRAVVKPLIEVIAGIPTVVFGLFALVTVGPFLRDWIAVPTGLGNSGSSVMTAGIVIGILNIPFISSLADDIINAVPQAMRDGSYGLGATKSETIRQVILPAALPGIVGAVLLAASRAIGETMIVTMGAGASAALDLNPFQAMTTITVKIVSQLTGDTEFNSPETLVAFALGMTLFVITLGLNIFALYIVRRYKEQYE